LAKKFCHKPVGDMARVERALLSTFFCPGLLEKTDALYKFTFYLLTYLQTRCLIIRVAYSF